MPRRALASVCAVLFLTFLDNTVISVALANIQTTLHSGVTSLQWIVDGYMLAFAALMLTGGTLGDLLGRKRVMLAGVGVFCAGSIIAALAPDGGTLIAGRVIMGLGAAASEPGTLSVIRHIFPGARPRARALGAWAAVSGVALAVGPVIGGLIIGGAGWRGIFWFNLAFGACALAAAAITVPETSDPQGRRLDVPGLALGAAALGAATFGVIQGEIDGYATWWIDLLFAVAFVCAVAFLGVERRSPDPVLQLRFFRSGTFSGANVVAFTTNWGVLAVFFFIALYLQLIGGFSGWRIALQFAAMAAAMVAAAPLAARWTARAGPRAPMAVGALVAGGGMIAVDQVIRPGVPVGTLAWALAITGFGFGMALVTMTAAVLDVVPPERSGMAASTVNTSRELGGVFGVAVLGAIMSSEITAHLAHRLRELGIPANFRQLVINAITHGAVVPQHASAVSSGAAGGAAKGHAQLVQKVINAADQAFGSGLHVLLLLAAAMLIASAVLAALVVRDPERARSAPRPAPPVPHP